MRDHHPATDGLTQLAPPAEVKSLSLSLTPSIVIDFQHFIGYIAAKRGCEKGAAFREQQQPIPVSS